MTQALGVIALIPAAPAACAATLFNNAREAHRDAAQNAPQGSVEQSNHLRYKAYCERQLFISVLVGLGCVLFTLAYVCAWHDRSKMEIGDKFASTGLFPPAARFRHHFLMEMKVGKWGGVASASLAGLGLVQAVMCHWPQPPLPDVANRGA